MLRTASSCLISFWTQPPRPTPLQFSNQAKSPARWHHDPDGVDGSVGSMQWLWLGVVVSDAFLVSFPVSFNEDSYSKRFCEKSLEKSEMGYKALSESNENHASNECTGLLFQARFSSFWLCIRRQTRRINTRGQSKPILVSQSEKDPPLIFKSTIILRSWVNFPFADA